jgi:hypothetical protein
MYLTIGSVAVVILIEIPSFLVLPGVTVLWILNIVAAKKMVGDAKCSGFQQIIENTKLLRMRWNILTFPR